MAKRSIVLKKPIDRGLLQEKFSQKYLFDRVLETTTRHARSDGSHATNYDLSKIYQLQSGGLRYRVGHKGLGMVCVRAMEQYLLQIGIIDVPHEFDLLPYVNPRKRVRANSVAKMLTEDDLASFVFIGGLYRSKQSEKGIHLVYGREYNKKTGFLAENELKPISQIQRFRSWRFRSLPQNLVSILR